MLIVNADDWGRCVAETDAALACFRAGRITSVTGMVFMQDSERAARLALDYGLEVGLHLNLNQPYDVAPSNEAQRAHQSVMAFLGRHKLAQLVYHPGLRNGFHQVYKSQLDEFLRLYGQPPSHVDGHQHRHLCANMLIDGVIERGAKVRRSFSYRPGEKSWGNRAFRRWVDRWLSRRYRITDFFFSLGECLEQKKLERVQQLAREQQVELMTHPVNACEFEFLMGNQYDQLFGAVPRGTYSGLT